MFDLMSVEGINQATAARIINYRENKGTIKYLDDLRRVGISLKRLSAIKAYLTTEDLDSDLSSTVSSNSPGRTPKHPNGKGKFLVCKCKQMQALQVILIMKTITI